MARAILVINAGSSSLKYALYRIDDGALLLVQNGLIDKLQGAPHFVARDADGATVASRDWPQGALAAHDGAIAFLLEFLAGPLRGSQLVGVGHRVVHGGAQYLDPVRITPAIVTDLERLVPLAPLHQPHNLAPIRIFAQRAPSLPQVACFDTAFHATAPKLAQAFALPREMSDAGIRRYGFHGLSYEFIAARLREIDAVSAAGRVVVAHLGNGASMCAMVGGKSVATTMGLTAIDGLVMGTRTGSIDPGVLLYLQRERGMDERALDELLYHRSGLLGVSGISSDMRVLLASDDPHAQFAIDLFCYRAVRERIVAPLRWLGFACDAEANARHASHVGAPGSKPVFVIPTDEERMIAQHTRGIIEA